MGKIVANHWSKGEGPTVLCLHCSASSSKHFEPLAESISGRYRVIAADLYGYGGTPMWSGKSIFSLEGEVDLLDGIFGEIEGQIFVVGHSYGAAVGLTAALRYPQKIAGIVAYEPVLFGLLRASGETSTARREIESIESGLSGQLALGKPAEAARVFVDYWSGPGKFASMPEKLQAHLAAKMAKVALDFEAVFNARATLHDYEHIAAPIVLLYGIDSPAPSRMVTDLLARAIPRAEIRGLLGLGHMGMVTAPELVNPVVAKFLDYLSAGRAKQEPAPTTAPH